MREHTDREAVQTALEIAYRPAEQVRAAVLVAAGHHWNDLSFRYVAVSIDGTVKDLHGHVVRRQLAQMHARSHAHIVTNLQLAGRRRLDRFDLQAGPTLVELLLPSGQGARLGCSIGEEVRIAC